MTLKLYNTRTRTKEEFRPLDKKNVRMYVCGPTVYDYAHIGNARPIIIFDVLFRLLKHLYGEDHVTYVRNITDVDDKINARAAERFPGMPLNEAIRKVTEETATQFHKDVAALGCLPPTHEPRATETIAEMIVLIEKLIERGHAYVADGHVLFEVGSMADYGQLARRSLDEMRAGARVEVAPYKRDAMDFVLWKPSSKEEPGWDSPWGRGRPGWHIECSAMSAKFLGETFDIHGGGIDLVFPHHENEVAQSRCAHGTEIMANVWMHNGFLQVEGQKMSKSLGNFVTINELLQDWPGEVIRLAMLKTRYREPINWTVARLQESWNELSDWVDVCYRGDATQTFEFFSESVRRKPDTDFIVALCDDLNTPEAITRIRSLYKAAIRDDSAAIRDLRATLIWLGLYRPAYHWAYSYSSFEGAEVNPALLSKYRSVFIQARAIVLNEYRWDTKDASERERSRQFVEEKINQIDSGMVDDGVRLQLHEHCSLSLVPLNSADQESKEKVETLIAARLAARKAKNWAEADRIRDELAAQGITLKDAKDPKTGEIVTTWEIAR